MSKEAGHEHFYAENGLMHMTILICNMLEYRFFREHRFLHGCFNFYLTVLYSVINDMIMEVNFAFTKQLLLMRIAFVLKTKHGQRPNTFTPDQWETIEHTRLALAMG
jgi:hypothetical protein